jgi:hypothetical protein
MSTRWILIIWLALFAVALWFFIPIWDDSITYSLAGRELPDWVPHVAAPLVVATILTGVAVSLVLLIRSIRLRRLPDATMGTIVAVGLALLAMAVSLVALPSLDMAIP